MHWVGSHWYSSLAGRSAEGLAAFAPPIASLSSSSTCLTYIPVAMSCTPFLDIARSSRSPLLSMDMTSLRSIMQPRLSWLWCALFQVVLSSLTHGPTRHPCTIHLLSVGVSVIVIFSTSTSHVCYAHAPG